MSTSAEETYHTETIFVDLSGQLEMHATQDGSEFCVDLHGGRDFGNDVDKVSGFQRRVRLGGFCAARKGLDGDEDGHMTVSSLSVLFRIAWGQHSR